MSTILSCLDFPKNVFVLCVCYRPRTASVADQPNLTVLDFTATDYQF